MKSHMSVKTLRCLFFPFQNKARLTAIIMNLQNYMFDTICTFDITYDFKLLPSDKIPLDRIPTP